MAGSSDKNDMNRSTHLNRVMGIKSLPSVEVLEPEEKLTFAEMIQHVAMVQMLLKNDGTFIVEKIGTKEELQHYIDLKFKMRGLGDGKVEIALVHAPNIEDVL